MGIYGCTHTNLSRNILVYIQISAGYALVQRVYVYAWKARALGDSYGTANQLHKIGQKVASGSGR